MSEQFSRALTQHFEDKDSRSILSGEDISIETAPTILNKALNSPGGKELLSRLFLQQDSKTYDENKKEVNSLTNEQVVEQVINLLQLEEQQLASVREANKETIIAAHHDLEGIAKTFKFNWQKGTEVRLAGPRMYSLYNLADNIKGELPPEEVRAGCDVGGQYFLNINQAVVSYQPEAKIDNRPWEEFLYHAIVHEGLHLIGGKIYNQNGEIIKRGIGNGAGNEVYASVLEEGLVEYLTRKIETTQGRILYNRYPKEVALLQHFQDIIGENFLKWIISAHREGESGKFQAELNRIFGQGFFDLYRDLDESLIEHWTEMSKEEIRGFVSLVITGENLKIILPPYNDNKVRNAVKDYFREIANKIMAMSLPGSHKEEKCDQLLSKLPHSIRKIFKTNTDSGFTVREQVKKEIEGYVFSDAKKQTLGTV